MLTRLFDRLWFRLERWVQRGAQYQLLVVAGVIVLISVVGGFLAFLLTDVFNTAGAAIWWSFLRLSDPGYLGDDEGFILRTISTIITVLGYVLFLGSLVAIMTQWWRERMEYLESGYTPIAANGHILVLGWTNRTSAIVQELVYSQERVKRFLRRRGMRNLRIVLLAQQVDASLIQELRDDLGPEWDENMIVLRSGSSLQIEHLRRVDFAHASVIVLPAADYTQGGATAVDARVVKTLMSITDYGETENVDELPSMVTEIFDPAKMPLANAAYGGNLDVIPTNRFLSRLIIQNVRHHRLSFIVDELLTHRRGNDIYVRSFSQLAGKQFGDLRALFPRAIPLGVVRPTGNGFEPHLNPPETYVLSTDDRVAFISRRYKDIEPRSRTHDRPAPLTKTEPPPLTVNLKRRILMLGWSNRSPALLDELASYRNEPFEITVLSSVAVAERRHRLANETDLSADQLAVEHVQGEFTSEITLKKMDPASYDNVIFLGSPRVASGEASDARTILGFTLLQSMLAANTKRPDVLVELMDPENAKLFRHRPGEILVSPRVLSHVMAHVALRRELNAVFDELFTSGGAEIFFRPAEQYEAVNRTISFQALEETAARFNETALGVCLARPTDNMPGGICLNPSKTRQWNLTKEDQIIVLVTYDDGSRRISQKSEKDPHK